MNQQTDPSPNQNEESPSVQQPGRTKNGYWTEHSLTPSHLPSMEHFTSVVYTGARVVETAVLGIGGVGLSFAMSVAEFGESRRQFTDQALNKYPFTNKAINFKGRGSCQCFGIAPSGEALHDSSRLIANMIRKYDVILVGGKIEERRMNEISTLAAGLNIPILNIDPYSPVKEAVADTMARFTAPAAALLLLLGNYFNPKYSTIGEKRPTSIARFSRRGFLRLCGFASLTVATPSPQQVKATIDNEPYPKADIGFTVDGRTVLMTDRITNYLAERPEKRVLVITPEPWAAGIAHYAANPESLSWRSKIYRRTYAALIGRPVT